MTKKTRTILFLTCLFLFVLVTPTVIFYSLGYRINFETKRITQTGGLFLKVLPRQVEVFIDGKLKEKTDFFSGSILIKNLLPKKYKIRIEKANFYPWEKALEIKEKEVTEAKNIILIPKNPKFIILTKGVEEFWFSPDEKKIILSEKTEAGWALKLYNLERNVKSHLVDDKDIYSPTKISGEGADLLHLEFSRDSKEIYLNIGVKDWDSTPPSIIPSEAQAPKNFVLRLDKVPPVLTERKIAPIPENIVASQVFNGDNYYLDNSGHLFKNNEKLTEKPFPVKAETEYKLSIFPGYIFLHEGQTLYLFNSDSKSFEKFFEPVKDIKISPDFKKIVYFSNYEIWVLFSDSDPQTSHREKDRVFLTRFSEKIGEVFWYTNFYLLFNTGDKIKIAEIDDRDKINIVDLAEFKNPKIFWSQTEKKLYILSQGNLFVSENLQK